MNRVPNLLRSNARRFDRWASRLESIDEQKAGFYDEKFETHPEYAKHYTESVYYPIWTVLADRLRPLDAAEIVELGCGPGQLAQLLHDHGVRRYHGIDFSGAAISAARQRCPSFVFSQRDLTRPGSLNEIRYTWAISTEVLEHIEDDLAVLRNVASGTRVLATVPNYPATGHLRTFGSERQVRIHYSGVLTDLDVTPIRLNRRGGVLFVIDGTAVGPEHPATTGDRRGPT